MGGGTPVASMGCSVEMVELRDPTTPSSTAVEQVAAPAIVLVA